MSSSIIENSNAQPWRWKVARFFRVLFLILVCSATLSIGISQTGNAQVKVTSKVDKTLAGENELIVLTVEVEGSGRVATPQLPEMEDFRQVSGVRSQSSQTYHFGTGAGFTSQALSSFSFTLRPLRTGKLTIPPIPVQVGRKTYQSTPIEVEVVQSISPSTPSPTTPDAAARPQRKRTQDEIFYEASLDRDRVFVGEQVILTYRLYVGGGTQVSIPRNAYSQSDLEGFVVHPLDLDMKEKRIMKDGNLYGTVERLLAIFPLRPGTLKIPPGEMVVSRAVQRPRRSFFNMTERIMLTSEPLTLEVRPLPEEGRPEGFEGTVGPSFDFQAGVQPSEVEVGTPVYLTMKLVGEGNPESFPDPVVTVSDSFKSYEPERDVRSRPVDDRLYGYIEFEQILVPNEPGQLTIPEVSFTYFNTVLEQYETLTRGPFLVTASPASGQSVGEIREVVTAPGKREIRITGRDIFPIHDTPLAFNSFPADRLPVRQGLVLLLALPGICGLIWAVQVQVWRLQEDSYRNRNRRALQTARRELKQLDQLDGSDFYSRLGQILGQFVADKLEMTSGGMTSDEIEFQLKSLDIKPDAIAGFVELLRLSDEAAYGGASTLAKTEREIIRRALDETSRLNSALDNSVKRKGREAAPAK